MNSESDKDENGGRKPQEPCIPGTNAQVFPPSEVWLVTTGLAIGLTLGFALGALFGAKVGRR